MWLFIGCKYGNCDVYIRRLSVTCIHFIFETTKLDQYLINKDFSRFVAGYNGPGYKNNNYDDRLWAAYDRYA